MDFENKLISTIRARIYELKQELNKRKKPDEVAVIQTAIATNCAWLLKLGQKLEGIEV